MTPFEIGFLAVAIVVAVLVYLIVSHKISAASVTAQLQGVANQLHLIHTTVSTGAPAPAATTAQLPPVTTAAPPMPQAAAPAAPAPAPAPAPSGPILGPATISSLGGSTAGNAQPGAPVGTFDARTLISDASVLMAGGTKFRTPPGVKPFTFDIEAGKSYMMETADGNAPTDIVVRRPDGTILAHGESGNGYAQASFRADVTGTAVVVVTFGGTYPNAGIEVHEVAATPDTSNLTGK